MFESTPMAEPKTIQRHMETAWRIENLSFGLLRHSQSIGMEANYKCLLLPHNS